MKLISVINGNLNNCILGIWENRCTGC